jgi:hypothetical protein
MRRRRASRRAARVFNDEAIRLAVRNSTRGVYAFLTGRVRVYLDAARGVARSKTK